MTEERREMEFSAPGTIQSDLHSKDSGHLTGAKETIVYRDVGIQTHVFRHVDGRFAVEFTLIHNQAGRESKVLYPSFGLSFATSEEAEQAGLEKARSFIDRKR